MKDHYDFSKSKRGAVLPTSGKERITIRLDADILDYFREAVVRRVICEESRKAS